MSRQLTFDIPHQTAFKREDFYISTSNKVAFALIDDVLESDDRRLAISGPRGCGKTHLAHIWATKFNARIIQAHDIADYDIPNISLQAIAVENVPQIATDMDAQRNLFHLHNLTFEFGQRLLVTGQESIKRWGLSLPDLQSRIESFPSATLEEPDDLLLSAILGKLFHDRQIIPKMDVIPYLVTHMERSINAARQIVKDIDHASLAQRRNVTRSLARDVLAENEHT